MNQNIKKEVLITYERFIKFFFKNDMKGINSLVQYPITYISEGKSELLDSFYLTPKEMMENKEWDTSIDITTSIHGITRTKAHVISTGTRIRKDKSVIEKYTIFYAFIKTEDGWKMYAMSDVISD
jgi:hypothetical protein